MRFAPCCHWIAVAIVISATAARAQPPEASEQSRIDAALELTRQCATDYRMAAEGAGPPFQLHPQPVLRWSNPERGQIYGNVFLWTANGRPQVVGSLFKWYSPFTHMSHEFQSLSRTGLVATYREAEVWRTAEHAVRFSAVPEAPKVAETSAGRLIQMRQAAMRLTARATDRDNNQHELRLLSKPVYRYELPPAEADLVDGALFVFVQGTDPEVWLQVEAQGQPAVWHYALTRMNSITLTVNLDGREVWSEAALPWADISAHKRAYTSFRFDKPAQ
jgi:hypothetical protein